jgi:hypothetical protein
MVTSVRYYSCITHKPIVLNFADDERGDRWLKSLGIKYASVTKGIQLDMFRKTLVIE